MWRRVPASAAWAFVAWVLLTWTFTVEQLTAGVIVSVAIGFALMPIERVEGPWMLAHPRRAARLILLAGSCAARIVRANLSLSRRILSPRLDVPSGMVVVRTRVRSPAQLTAVGILTSVVVDNQVVDVDRRAHEIQYHAVAVKSDEPEENRRAINGPVEERLLSGSGIR